MPPPKKIFKTREQIEHEKTLEMKARYRLRTLEDGSVDPTDKTLLFESRFESGNLYLAQKVSDVEYNLLCLLYTSPSQRDRTRSRMPSSA